MKSGSILDSRLHRQREQTMCIQTSSKVDHFVGMSPSRVENGLPSPWHSPHYVCVRVLLVQPRGSFDHGSGPQPVVQSVSKPIIDALHLTRNVISWIIFLTLKYLSVIVASETHLPASHQSPFSSCGTVKSGRADPIQQLVIQCAYRLIWLIFLNFQTSLFR